jgi:enoyl-CoA hydratase
MKKRVEAGEAKKIGVVDKVASSDPVKAAYELMAEIHKNAPVAIRSAIQAVYHSGHNNGYQVEADLFGELCETEDFIEGTSAFLEKRKPDFKGE